VIERVKLVNFLSHANTEIELGEGLTVFIGRNGAGKSSVIDAITYAFYGQHTRGKKGTHVRDGANRGKVELELRLSGRKYEIVREFDGRGELRTAAIREDGRLLVTGEKRDDSRVSKMVSSILGLNYERMKSSVVIQQGEIDAILKDDPKELKELFDDLMGLKTFDDAFDEMKIVLDGFKEKIKKMTGRSPEDVKVVEQELDDLRKDVESTKEREKSLVRELEGLKAEYRQVSERVEKLKELVELDVELRSILKGLKERIRGEVKRLEERVVRLEGALRHLSRKEEVEAKVRRHEELKGERLALIEREKAVKDQLEKIKEELKVLPGGFSGAKTLEELKGEARERAERLRDDSMELGRALAGGMVKLDLYELRDRVERDVESVVNLVFESYTSAMASRAAELTRRKEELHGELNSIGQRLKDVEKEAKECSTLEGQDVNRLHAQVLAAEQEVSSAGGEDGVKSLIEKLKGLRARHEKLTEVESPLDLDLEVLEGLDVLLGDGEVLQLASRLHEGVAKLRESGFSAEIASELEGLRKRKEELSREIGQKEGELRGLQAVMEEKRRRAEELERALGVLRKANEFYALMEKVRKEVYHRDGPVLKSLRTWIYSRVRERARGYLDMFDSAVDDVRIEEEGAGKGSKVVFRCYYRGREVSWERLSGGEKVVLALAFRLAIGDVLGAQRLRFFILDEPTVHLDSEKRKRLREVLMRLSQKMPQVIVITHDEEIFEGSEARVLRFEKEGGATRVVEVGRQAIGG
jgi:exonuclease SbcC